MELILFWFVLSILVGVFANSRGKSGILYFIFSIILSPLLGFLIALVSGDDSKSKCLKCGQKIDIKAKVCPYCLDKKEIGRNKNLTENDIENEIIKKEDSYKLILKKNFTPYSVDKVKEILIKAYDGKCTPEIRINDNTQLFIKGIIENYEITNIRMKIEEYDYLIESYKIPIPDILLNKNDVTKDENNKNVTNTDKLIELGKLYKDGLLTKEEFDEQKELLKKENQQ